MKLKLFPSFVYFVSFVFIGFPKTDAYPSLWYNLAPQNVVPFVLTLT